MPSIMRELCPYCEYKVTYSKPISALKPNFYLLNKPARR